MPPNRIRLSGRAYETGRRGMGMPPGGREGAAAAEAAWGTGVLRSGAHGNDR